MAIYTIQESTLTDIADAIRAKKGTTADIQVSNFATEISGITSGGGSSGPTITTNTFIETTLNGHSTLRINGSVSHLNTQTLNEDYMMYIAKNEGDMGLAFTATYVGPPSSNFDREFMDACWTNGDNIIYPLPDNTNIVVFNSASESPLDNNFRAYFARIQTTYYLIGAVDAYGLGYGMNGLLDFMGNYLYSDQEITTVSLS